MGRRAGAAGRPGVDRPGWRAHTRPGQAAHAAVEKATDLAAARPWARLDPAATGRLARALTPIAQACARVVPYPSPIGEPSLATAARSPGLRVFFPRLAPSTCGYTKSRGAVAVMPQNGTRAGKRDQPWPRAAPT